MTNVNTTIQQLLEAQRNLVDTDPLHHLGELLGLAARTLLEETQRNNALIKEAASDMLKLQNARKELAELRALLHCPGVRAIAHERQRQIRQEGWTAEHDDQHKAGELAAAAMSYAMSASYQLHCTAETGVCPAPMELPEAPFWPFSADWWKPRTPERDLERAGALVAAQIRVLARTATTPTDGESPCE